MTERWRVAEHNGGYVDERGDYQTSEWLAQMLRVVYREGPDEYTEFAVAAGDAARLMVMLNRRDRVLSATFRALVKKLFPPKPATQTEEKS